MIGPLLFILYTNDLPNSLKHSKSILFADDTTVYLSANNINNLIDMIKADLTQLADWFYANKLSLNVTKTNFMVFCPNNCNKYPNITKIKLGENDIQRVNIAKFLGLHIDDELNWGNHINHVASKLASGSYALNSIKKMLSVNNLRQIYFSLLHCHLSYGILLWGGAFDYQLH